MEEKYICYGMYVFDDPAFSCTMLDVGQGNGILIQTAKKTILVDGGSSDVTEVGKYRLLPCLKYYGITCIDAMIMTHADTDHISGQLELIEMMQKGQIGRASCRERV